MWTDAGVNLNDPRLQKYWEHMQSTAIDHGVLRVLVINTHPDTAGATYDLDPKLNLYKTLGLHPHYSAAESLEQLKRTVSQVDWSQYIAVGEAGLDFNRMAQSRPDQIAAFEYQCNLAKSINKPIYLHQRDAHNALINILDQYCINRGIAHCFTGSKEQLRDYLDRGLYIGITGWLCDERRNHELLEAIKYLPIDRVIFETDAPYLTPRTLRPKPKGGCNFPAYIPHIAGTFAGLKDLDIEQVRQAAEDNFEALFLDQRT